MKTKHLLTSIATVLAVISCGTVCAQQPEGVSAPLPVAVFDFQAGDKALEKKGVEIAVLLAAQLSTRPEVFLVERQELEKLLSEQEMGVSGAIAPETAAKVGSLVGAKVLVTGRVFESGGKGYLVAKIIGAETSRVFGEMAVAPSLNDLDAPSAQLAEKIAGTLAKQAGVFVAKTETLEARAERLKKLVAGKRLPPVAIRIPEQHLSRPVPDPAAETELTLMLREVGFEVIAIGEAAARPDALVISGEAFSEFGMRRGNLVFCRARVEVVVKDAAGKQVLVGRQNDVAIDVAEHVAGKRALENAALKLADSLVPRLAK